MLAIQPELSVLLQEGVEAKCLKPLLPSFPEERPRRAARLRHLRRAQSSSISARANKPDDGNSSLPGSCSWKAHSLAGEQAAPAPKLIRQAGTRAHLP